MANHQSGSSPLADLEAKIRQAGNYVQPSSDLRPKTLEAAQERGAVRRGSSFAFTPAATSLHALQYPLSQAQA